MAKCLIYLLISKSLILWCVKLAKYTLTFFPQSFYECKIRLCSRRNEFYNFNAFFAMILHNMLFVKVQLCWLLMLPTHWKICLLMFYSKKSLVKTFHLILVLLIKCNDTLCSKEFESVLLSLWSTKKYQLTFYMIHLVSIFKDLHQFAKLNALKDPKGT